MNYKAKYILEHSLSPRLCNLDVDNLESLKQNLDASIDKFCRENNVSQKESIQALYRYMRSYRESQYFSQFLVDWFPTLLDREDIDRPTYREVSIYYDLYGEDARTSMEMTIRSYCRKYNIPIKQVVDELNLRMKSRRAGFKSKNLEEWFPDVYGTDIEK